jgi:hypothetical protein
MNYLVLPLGEILAGEYNLQKIEEAFKRFSCDREKDLEDFLVHKAIEYEKMDFGKTYLCIDQDALAKGEFEIAAYFTIANKAIDLDTLSKNQRRKIFGQYPGRDTLKSIPAYLIGQIGRCDRYAKEDLSGEQLLNECYHTISMVAKIIGGNLIVLECREHMFDKFYKDQGYKKFYKDLSDDGLYTLYKKFNFKDYWKH